ncbi:MAG: hypothetical protein V3U67_02260 [Gemmatimonadota bacterium]
MTNSWTEGPQPLKVPAVLVAALLLCAPSGLAAQDGGVQTEITGFEGLAWGTPASAVLASFGEPGQEELQDSLTLLAYQSARFGYEAVVLFAVHQSHGLVMGKYLMPLNEENDCEVQFREVRRQVNITYPLIRPTERRYNNAPEDLCEAQAAGNAGWLIQWTDEKNLSTIVVVLSAGKSDLQVAYESALFKEWAATREERARDLEIQAPADSAALEPAGADSAAVD